MTLGSEELRSEFWEYYEYFAGATIPMPMLAERLGLVEVQDAEWLSEEEIRKKTYLRRITVDFRQMVGILSDAFEGNVRFGSRTEKDKLFHFHRKEIESTMERVLALFEGPMMPRGEEDEERMAKFKKWLSEQDGELLQAGIFYGLFFG